jgi:hypothetical protein
VVEVGVEVGGADSEATYNLCLILENILQKSCHKCNYNIKLFAITCSENHCLILNKKSILFVF